MALLTTSDLKRILTDQGVSVPRFAGELPIGHRMLDLHDDFVRGLRCLGIAVDEAESGWSAPAMIVRLDPKSPEQRLAVGKYQANGGLVGCLADDEYYEHDPAGAGIAHWDFKVVLCDEAASLRPLGAPHVAVPVWCAPLPPESFLPGDPDRLISRCLYAGKPKADRLAAVAQFGNAVEWLEVPKQDYEYAMGASAASLFLNSKSHFGSVTPRLKECLSSTVTLLPTDLYHLRHERPARLGRWGVSCMLNFAKVANGADVHDKVRQVLEEPLLRQAILHKQAEFLELLLDAETAAWFS